MATPGPTVPASKDGNAVNADGKSSRIFDGADYTPILSNWYSAKPYGFKFTPRTGAANAMVMFLPIGPSNLSISTNFATSVTPTIYGTVEEHSPVRYYDISIEGTTGMGPRYVKPFAAGATPDRAGGRSRFTVQQSISAGGFFAKTLNTAQNAFAELNTKLDPTTLQASPPPTGLQLDQTGYAAFHNLYRFLLKYKKDAAGVDSNGSISRDAGQHPLVFFNYKDNNQYKVTIRGFTLRRDKEDPMMYHYSISMRGYDLAPAGEDFKADNTKLLSDLGLAGVDDAGFLGQAKEFATKAKGVLGSIGNGASQLGR